MREGVNSTRSYVRVLEWSVLVPSLLFAAAFIYVACKSMPFAFMLEWMEGQTIDAIRRVIEGKPLYIEPDVEYVPLIYPPYYYYVAAFFSLLTGGDFLPARLVSFLATLGSCWIVYMWVRREQGGWRSALTAACLFLATYRLSGRWFDMSRVDSLFLFLTLSGLYLLVHMRGSANAFAAALLLAAAFYTKQTALIIAAPVFLAMMCIDLRHAVTTGIILAFMLLALLVLLNYNSDGWFSFFAFIVPAGHPMEDSMYRRFWTEDVFGHVGIWFVLALVVIGYLVRYDLRRGLLYLGMAVGCVGAAYLSRLHSFGYINVLMPMHVFLALMAGIALSRARKAPRAGIALPLTGMLVLVELATLLYDPVKLIPTGEMHENGTRLLQQLGKYEGDALLSDIQYIQTRVGKRSYGLGMAALDLQRSNLKDMDYIKKNFSKRLDTALKRRQFAVIVPGRMMKLPGLRKHYRLAVQNSYSQRYVTGAIRQLPGEMYQPLLLGDGGVQ